MRTGIGRWTTMRRKDLVEAMDKLIAEAQAYIDKTLDEDDPKQIHYYTFLAQDALQDAQQILKAQGA